MKLAGIKVAAARAAAAAGGGGGGGGKDEERGGGGGGPRSRDDILGEIRRLQDEMGRLESKAGFGAGGSNGIVSAAAAAKTA